MRLLSTILPLLLIGLLLSSCSNDGLPSTSVTYDLLIENARIVDGTGAPAYDGSILVADGLIIYAGKASLSDYTANERLDAAGRVVSPGFIDAHAHGNAEMNPLFRNFWSMGVTSIGLGMDGRSPGIDDLPDWFQRVEEARPAVNIIHFVGHGTARNHAELPMERGAATAQDLTRLTELIDSQLEAGSFGVSTGIEYIPGVFANREELAAVGQVVSRHDGLITSHIRNEDDDAVKNSVRELIQMGADGNARVNVSHIKIVYANDSNSAEGVLAVMDSARAAGVDISADVYPYTASFTGIGILYPDWALPPNDFAQVKRDRRDDLAEYLRNRVNRRNGPEATSLGSAPWSGRTLAEIAEEMELPFEDVLIDHMPPGSASAAYFVMNIDVMRRFLQDEHISVSSDGSPTMLHPRGYGSFARIIRQFVVEENAITIEEAIQKMSSMTAATMRLDVDRSRTAAPKAPITPSVTEETATDVLSDEGDVSVSETDDAIATDVHSDLRLTPRGLLKAGFAADILVFNPALVRDTATFEEPHQYATGFDYVFVNGVAVQANGEPTGARPGLVLRRK